MIWQEVTHQTVESHLPSDVKTAYDEWIIANPTKATRLAEITANTIREFRDAIKSNRENSYDERESFLPQSAVRHCESIIIFSLGMEMGLTLDSAGNSARVTADVFLRSIPYGRYKTEAEEGSKATPRFAVPESASPNRTLQWAVAVLLAASTAWGGWIKPDSAPPRDTGIATTFIPSAYAITTATLYGHLYGINAALTPLATTNYVNSAVAAVSLTNSVDETARALATAASVAANAAMHSFDAYTKTDVVIPSEPRWTGAAPSKNIKFVTTQGDNTWTNELRAGAYPGDPQADSTNLWWNGAKVHVGDVVSFPAGDVLTGDGTNLFYVNAAKTITNQLTGN